jgi:hypothetical protein
MAAFVANRPAQARISWWPLMSMTGVLRIASTVKQSNTTLDLAIVERAARTCEEIVDPMRSSRLLFTHSLVSLARFVVWRCYALPQVEPTAVAHRVPRRFRHSSHCSTAAYLNWEAATDLHGRSHSGQERCEEEAFVGAGIGGFYRPLA